MVVTHRRCGDGLSSTECATKRAEHGVAPSPLPYAATQATRPSLSSSCSISLPRACRPLPNKRMCAVRSSSWGQDTPANMHKSQPLQVLRLSSCAYSEELRTGLAIVGCTRL